VPFAETRIKVLLGLGSPYADQSFEVNGYTVRVQVTPGHEYISITGGGFDYAFDVKSDASEAIVSSEKIRITPSKKGSEYTVGVSVAKTNEQIKNLTDWKGKRGEVLLYDTGSPTRYRMEHPSSGLPALASIIYGSKKLQTNNRGVIGAGIFVAPNKHNILIYAVYVMSDLQQTRFYARDLSIPGMSSESVSGADDVLIGEYSPYVNNPDFNPNPLIPATWPDPWHFSPDGSKATSVAIKPRINFLRHGFVATVSFSCTTEGEEVTMDNGAVSHHTDTFTQYTGDTVIEDSVTIGYHRDVLETYVFSVFDEGTHELLGTDTYSSYSLRAVREGTYEVRWGGALTEVLVGSDFDVNGMLRAVTLEYGEYYTGKTVYSVLAINAGTVTGVTVMGGFYETVSAPTTSYPGSVYSTYTHSLTDGGLLERITYDEGGSKKLNVLKINGNVLYDMSPPAEKTTVKHGWNYLDMPPGTLFSTFLQVDRYRSAKHCVIVSIDARDDTVIAVEVRYSKDRSQYSEDYTVGGPTPDAVIKETNSSAVWFVVKGIAPREVQCTNEFTDTDAFVLGPMYFISPVTFGGIDRMAAYLTENVNAIGSGTAQIKYFTSWFDPDHREKAYGCSARTGELVYCVDMKAIQMALKGIDPVSGGRRPLTTKFEWITEQRIQVGLAIKDKNGNVFERKLMPKITPPDGVDVDKDTTRMEKLTLISKTKK